MLINVKKDVIIIINALESGEGIGYVHFDSFYPRKFKVHMVDGRRILAYGSVRYLLYD